MMKLIGRIAMLIGGGALLVLIVAYLAGVFVEKVEPGEVAAPLPETPEFSDTYTAERVAEPQLERVPGTLTAVREVQVSSRITATIGVVGVRAGDRVNKGQKLVELDSRDLRAREAQAREAVRAARSRLEEARREFERIEQLLRDGVATQSEFDSARAGYETAQADLARAEQAAEEAAAASSYATIEAPIAGRIIDRYAEPGDIAMPGQPLLGLYDPRRIRLEAYVRESLASRLRPGSELDVEVEALDFTVSGRVEEIVPQAEPGSRSVLVKVAMPEREDLYPGMFGRLMIETGEAERIYVPEAAVRRVGQLTFLWIVSEEGVPQRRFVKLGDNRRADDWIEVLSGIEAGERVGAPRA